MGKSRASRMRSPGSFNPNNLREHACVRLFGPHSLRGITLGVGVERLCQAEVQHLDGPVLAHLDVRGLEKVAMHHPGLMRGLQRLGDLLRNRQRLVQRDRPLRDQVGEGRVFHQLQHQRSGAVCFLDGGDNGVVEAGEDLRLPLEPGEAVRIAGEGVGEDLQGPRSGVQLPAKPVRLQRLVQRLVRRRLLLPCAMAAEDQSVRRDLMGTNSPLRTRRSL